MIFQQKNTNKCINLKEKNNNPPLDYAWHKQKIDFITQLLLRHENIMVTCDTLAKKLKSLSRRKNYLISLTKN